MISDDQASKLLTQEPPPIKLTGVIFGESDLFFCFKLDDCYIQVNKEFVIRTEIASGERTERVNIFLRPDAKLLQISVVDLGGKPILATRTFSQRREAQRAFVKTGVAFDDCANECYQDCRECQDCVPSRECETGPHDCSVCTECTDCRDCSVCTDCECDCDCRSDSFSGIGRSAPLFRRRMRSRQGRI